MRLYLILFAETVQPECEKIIDLKTHINGSCQVLSKPKNHSIQSYTNCLLCKDYQNNKRFKSITNINHKLFSRYLVGQYKPVLMVDDIVEC